jgi:hypothetical protein
MLHTVGRRLHLTRTGRCQPSPRRAGPKEDRQLHKRPFSGPQTWLQQAALFRAQYSGTLHYNSDKYLLQCNVGVTVNTDIPHCY